MRVRSSNLLPAVVALFVVSSPAALLAVDGVVEINQARAVAGSVTPGDTPGFPVNISVSGSYRLTSNLNVPNENTDGIDISASDVTLDLNGFSIVGPTVCTGGPPVTGCSPSGAGAGVNDNVGAPTPTGLTVKNGTIRGMGSHGLTVAAEVRVDNLRIESNGGHGINSTGAGGLTVTHCEVFRNGNAGINGNGAVSVTSSVVIGNKAAGITTNGPSDKATVLDNTIASNQYGITLTAGGVIRGNVISANTTFAMILGGSVATNAGYYGNAIYGSGTGGQVVNGLNLGANLCNGAACP